MQEQYFIRTWGFDFWPRTHVVCLSKTHFVGVRKYKVTRLGKGDTTRPGELSGNNKDMKATRWNTKFQQAKLYRGAEQG
jgi:hypothetical protein